MDSYLHNKKLLLVDDEPELLKMIASILYNDGFENEMDIVYGSMVRDQNRSWAQTIPGVVNHYSNISPNNSSTFSVSNQQNYHLSS